MIRAGAPLSLRPVDDADAIRLLRWWNDRETRRFSGDGAPVTLDDHLAWFFRNIPHDHWHVALAARGTLDPVPVGAVRFDQGASELRDHWWISVVVAPEHRGLGFGSRLIAIGTEEFWQRGVPGANVYMVPVYARVHSLNKPSLAAFAKAGYAPVREEGQHAVLRRPGPINRLTGDAP